jgi:cytoskeletal protein CcmA (bactofilin family)
MFSQSADKPAADESPAPIGMRELPPQPAKPVMPTYGTATPSTPEPAPEPAEAGPGAEDSVIAKDDHLEGTFTSRGTVVVMGSVKGRIEAVQVRIEDGASVDADVIVDEAIIAGEFTGNLTCRQRLEARASGRINGRVETFKLMLHEGASVEGEMHMLTEAPKDATETIRGSAPLRGEMAEAEARKPEPRPAAPAAATPPPSSGAKSAAAVGSSATVASSAAEHSSEPGPSPEASAVRSSVVETLRAESARVVAPRTTTATRGYGYSGPPIEVPRERKSTSTSGF